MLIHQESIIAAAPRAVYEVLTDGQKFATATGMPAQLSDRVGEAFSLFGGRVEGRQIELVPGQRIVQAWRFGAMHPSEWDAGVYSVVRFTLSRQQDGTRFIIEPHVRFRGLPGEQATMFFLDPFGNALEFKSFENMDQLFAKQ